MFNKEEEILSNFIKTDEFKRLHNSNLLPQYNTISYIVS